MVLRPGCLGDLAVLSEDYFSVPEPDIAHIEPLLTVVGGRIVYASAAYEGLDEVLPPVSPAGPRLRSGSDRSREAGAGLSSAGRARG